MRKLAAALAAVFLLPACLSGCAAPEAESAPGEESGARQAKPSAR